MTAPYDWARDPGATGPAVRVTPPPRPTGQLHRGHYVLPAVWVRYQPKQGPLVRWDYRPGAAQLQWRKPHLPRKFFRRN